MACKAYQPACARLRNSEPLSADAWCSFESASRDAPRSQHPTCRSVFEALKLILGPEPGFRSSFRSRLGLKLCLKTAMEASQEELECLGGERVDQVAPRTLLLASLRWKAGLKGFQGHLELFEAI